MPKLDYENMTEDIKKRIDVLLEYEQQAIEAIVETGDYSLEEALEVVESGDFEFYPEISTLTGLARMFVWHRHFENLQAMGILQFYIDFEKLGADLYKDNYRETSLGVIRALSDRDRYRQGFPDRGY